MVCREVATRARVNMGGEPGRVEFGAWRLCEKCSERGGFLFPKAYAIPDESRPARNPVVFPVDGIANL